MKNILIYAIGTIVIILLSLFLPYESHDFYSGGLFKVDVMLKSGITTSGFSHVAAYFPALFILICFVIIKLNESVATAIVSLVLSFGSLVYMGFLAIALQFHINIFNGPRNYELAIGYYIALWAILGYLVVTIIHLTIVVRKRRNQIVTPEPISSSDLLDDLLDR